MYEGKIKQLRVRFKALLDDCTRDNRTELHAVGDELFHLLERQEKTIAALNGAEKRAKDNRRLYINE